MEFMGGVVSTGSESEFTKGEKVTGFIYGRGKAYDGTNAEYSIHRRRRLFRSLRYAKLHWQVLAAIPISMWAAHGSLFEGGRLVVGGKAATVLVRGGTSTLGHWACISFQRGRVDGHRNDGERGDD